MAWYFVEDQERVGPYSHEQMQGLIEEGRIQPETLVWTEGMENWQPYSEIAGSLQPQTDSNQEATATVSGEQVKCAECKNFYPADEVIEIQGTSVCAQCKPIALQKLKEGLPLASEMQYGGFWIRFVAKFVDQIILQVVNLIVGFLVGMGGAAAGGGSGMSTGFIIFENVFPLVFAAAYTTYFLGAYGATVGKLACGLKVVTPEGERITYLRGFARYFAEILSGLILSIGYIIAAFDDEKRTLHDRICSTRVIRTR